jgi:hypothetical protein
MKRTIASIIYSWNSEKFIKAHIRMLRPLVDKMLLVQITRPQQEFIKSQGASTTPDNSENIARSEGLEVVYYTPTDELFGSSGIAGYNVGIDSLTDYDLVTRFDPDMFFTQSDLSRLLNFARSTDLNNIALDFSKQSINYYYDFDHGLMNQIETDPLIVSTKYRFGNMFKYPAPRYIYKGNVMMHHLRSWKPNITQDWLDGKSASIEGVRVTDVFKPGMQWLKAPEEIRRYFYET